MHNLLSILLTAIALATILNILFRQINIPTIIGYIFTGSIISIIFGIHTHGNEALEHLAEFGIVFLMFTIGLEFSMKEIKAMKKELFVFGFAQVMITGGVISLISHFLLQVEYKVSIIIGLGLALSSTAIVLKLLHESGEYKLPYGRGAKGILIFQDIALIPILLMVTIFASNDKSISSLLLDTAINVLITISILIILGKYVLTHFFKIVSNTNSKEIYMGSVFLVVIGASYIAHYFGFSYTLGAFIAGIMIAETMYKYQIEADLIPFRDLLLGVFFITIGMQIDFDVIANNITSILVLVFSIMMIKTLVIFSILRFFINSKEALKAGLSLAQIGEAALVVFSLILSYNMLDTKYIQITIVVIVISMILTPFMLTNLKSIINIFFKKPELVNEINQMKILEEHIILCGYGTFGQNISKKLDVATIEHQIITNNTDDFVKARQDNKNVFFGEPSDRVLLENLQISKSLGIIIALDELEEIEHVCANVNLIDNKINIMAKVHSDNDVEKLNHFNLKTVLDANEQVSATLVDDIIKSRLLAEETMKLKYLNNYDKTKPEEAIQLLINEQSRLLEIISNSFNGLRNNEDIILIKVYHDSFTILSEIINEVLDDLSKNESLSSISYQNLNTLLNIQDKYEQANNSLKELGKAIFDLSEIKDADTFCKNIVEGLDTILLTLKDIVHDYNDDDMKLLETMTSRNSPGIENIRSSYLNNENKLAKNNNRALLLSTTNLTERIIVLFGDIGQNYKKLLTK